MKKIIQKIFKSDQKKRSGKRKKIFIILLLIVTAFAGIFFIFSYKRSKEADAQAKKIKTAAVTKRDISSKLSSSGTISPKDTYDITSLAEGEVIEANFEEGDEVQKGQVLYRIDSSSAETQLTSANNSLERAQESYQVALDNYNDALKDYSQNTYKSTETGYISALSIKEGDKISDKTEIASIVDDSIMKIKLPFLSGEAAQIPAGSAAVLTLSDTGEQVNGTVVSVGNMDVTLTGGRIVRYVTMEVPNPGGLTKDISATATAGGFVCSMEGTFEAKLETTMKADLPSGVEVSAMLVHEGDYVTKGTPVFTIESKSAAALIRTYKDALDKAQSSLESAKNSLDNTQETYDNYTITAPISGKVITKSIKVGDKITKSTSGSTTLATIYDMSNYTFEMSVDELDVKSVAVGQKVNITADAVSGKTFSGTVTNVSLKSTTTDGVTNYPVTITLDDGMDDLLPGMNVDGIIVLNEASDVLTIPADALIRGNHVYIKDDTVKEANGAVPAGFKEVEVKTGLINDDYVEITSGLEENQEVYVAQTTVSTNKTTGIKGEMGGPPGGIGGAREGVRNSSGNNKSKGSGAGSGQSQSK
jgi:HlyD family secretion protein